MKNKNKNLNLFRSKWDMPMPYYKSKKDYNRRKHRIWFDERQEWFGEDTRIIEELEQILSGNFNYQKGEEENEGKKIT